MKPSVALIAAVCLLAGCNDADRQARSTTAPACAEGSPPPATAPASASRPSLPVVYHEAPMLAERVRRGLLPPVADRLPAEPLIVRPLEEIGRYGGTWTRLMTSTSDIHCYSRVTYDQLLRFAPNPKDGIWPNLVKSWAYRDGNKVLTLRLRKGLLWSDGHRFTVDDIIFWWEKIACNKNITPTIPPYWAPGGKPMRLKKLDDLTLEMHFAEPYPQAVRLLAFKGCQWPLAFERYGAYAPKHYLEPLMNKSYQAFEEGAYDLNPERPVMTAWRVKSWRPGYRMLAERNPYYWKIDPAGNQLPYVDYVALEVNFRGGLLPLRALGRALAQQMRGFKVEDHVLLKSFAPKRGYRVTEYPGVSGLAVALNLTYKKDPALRKLFQDRRFRIAMSLAVNREMIRKLASRNRALPATYQLNRYSPYYSKVESLPDYLRYDPEAAGKLLDELGLDRRDGDGFRRLPDGRTLSLIIDCDIEWPEVEIARTNWREVGVKVSIKPMQRTLFHQRTRVNGEHMAAVYGTGDGAFPILSPFNWFAVKPGPWDFEWAKWYVTKGAKGQKPPPQVRRLQQIYEALNRTGDIQECRRLMAEVVRNHAENVWKIHLVGPRIVSGVLLDEFRNVPLTGLYSWVVYCPGNQNPETFFFRDPPGGSR